VNQTAGSTNAGPHGSKLIMYPLNTSYTSGEQQANPGRHVARPPRGGLKRPPRRAQQLPSLLPPADASGRSFQATSSALGI